MKRLTLFACLVVLACGECLAAAPAPVAPVRTPPDDNPELIEIYAQDQADRTGSGIEWSVVAQRDNARLARVSELLRGGEIRTAADYHRAAMVFQHGATPEAIRLAHALATLAMTLDQDNKSYRWLTAASWDRMMMYHLQPQWFGTQFHGDSQGMYLYPVAEAAVTDTEREAMGVPTLAESKQRVTEAARMSGLAVREVPPTIQELQQQATKARQNEK